jgi:chitinase
MKKFLIVHLSLSWIWLSFLASALSTDTSSNVVVYWGQNSAGGKNTQKPLADYCNDDSADIILISFLHIFYGTSGLPEVNFSYACENTYFPNTGLLQCPTIGEDIKTCQRKGKTILLSLGGAAGSYGFSSTNEGTEFADTLWNLFLGGSSDTRPFGDAVLDGFDLDIEGGSNVGYVEFVNRLRKLFANDSSKQYYIAAAPQCVIPDHYLDTVIKNAQLDFLFVQFYNNYCGMQAWQPNNANPSFNYAEWDALVKASPNPSTKIFLGVPASESAAGSGYTSISTVLSAANYLQANYGSFGGIMMWDASQAWANVDDSGNNFAQAAKEGLIKGSGDSAENYSPTVSSFSAFSLLSASSTSSSAKTTSFSSSSLSSPYSTTMSIYASSSVGSSVLTTSSLFASSPTGISKSSVWSPDTLTTISSSIVSVTPNTVSTTSQQVLSNTDNSDANSQSITINQVPAMTLVATKIVVVTKAPRTVTQTISPQHTVIVERIRENAISFSETVIPTPVTSTITLEQTVTSVVGALTVTTTAPLAESTSDTKSVNTVVNVGKRELSASGRSSVTNYLNVDALASVSYKIDIQQLNQTHFRGIVILSSTQARVPVLSNWLVPLSGSYKIDSVGPLGRLVTTDFGSEANPGPNNFNALKSTTGGLAIAANIDPITTAPAMALHVPFWGRY